MNTLVVSEDNYEKLNDYLTHCLLHFNFIKMFHYKKGFVDKHEIGIYEFISQISYIKSRYSDKNDFKIKGKYKKLMDIDSYFRRLLTIKEEETGTDTYLIVRILYFKKLEFFNLLSNREKKSVLNIADLFLDEASLAIIKLLQ